MTDSDFLQSYRANPSISTLAPIIALYRSQNRLSELREILLNHYSKFALTEQIWIDWITDEFNAGSDHSSTLLSLALTDFPLSSRLHRLSIEKSTEKVAAVKKALESVGDFDNELWDECRSLCPTETKELFRAQLSRPVPDYDRVLGEFQLQLMMDGEDPFEPEEEIVGIAKQLELHRNDFQEAASAVALCAGIPREAVFERALVYHPWLPAIWAAYVSRFPSEKLAARAVRFCPTSGILWALRAKIVGKPETNGFGFVTGATEAQVLLGQLILLFERNDKAIVGFIKEVLGFPVWSTGDNWIWPTLLMEEEMRSLGFPVEDRRAVLRSTVTRAPQNVTVWLTLADFELKASGEADAREVFREAASTLKVDVPDLIEKWISFELSAKDTQYHLVLEKMIELSTVPAESGDHERRTVFVANLAAECTEEDLQQLFAQAGEVEAVRLKMRAGRPTFAFVQFRKDESAETAVRLFAGTVLKGQSLDVKPHGRPQILTLFIRFAAQTPPGEVIQFLRDGTGIRDFHTRLANAEGSGKTKGWGFIDVQSEPDALKFLALNGKMFNGRAIKVEVANQGKRESSREKKKKEQTPSSRDQELMDFFGIT
jgi:hypothetical protein